LSKNRFKIRKGLYANAAIPAKK